MKFRIAALLPLLGISRGLSAEQKHDLSVAAAQAAPGVVASSGARALGLPLSDWAVIATILFVILQAGNLVWKWRRDYLREQERKRCGKAPEPTDLGAL